MSVLVAFPGSAHAGKALFSGNMAGGWAAGTAPPTTQPPAPFPGFQPVPFAGNGIPGPPTSAPGAATVTGASPANFTLPAGAFYVQTSFTRPTTLLATSVISSKSVATISNAGGNFFAGGGQGGGTITGGAYSAGQPGTFKVTAGPNQFGGTMNLVGQLTSILAIASGGGTWTGAAPFPFGVVGGPAGVKSTTTVSFYHNTLQTSFPITGRMIAGPKWTTGKITASDFSPNYSSRFSVQGYDSRTPLGTNGTIQMVSGSFFRFDGFITDDSVLLFSTKATFLPEPDMLASLIAGGLLLTALYRRRKTVADRCSGSG